MPPKVNKNTPNIENAGGTITSIVHTYTFLAVTVLIFGITGHVSNIVFIQQFNKQEFNIE